MSDTDNKLIYKRSIYRLVEDKQILRHKTTGKFYLEMCNHIRLDNKTFYGKQARQYILDNNPDALMSKENLEEVN